MRVHFGIFGRSVVALSMFVVATVATIGAASAATGAHLTITPTSHNFGTVNAGATSPTQTFVVQNTGTAAAGTTTALAQTGSGNNLSDWLESHNTCGATLPPGGHCSFDLTFVPAPLATGSRSAKVTVSAQPGG